MRGPRVAQYWLGANPDLPEIHVVCNLGDSWVMMPDGTDGVEQYFQNHYENGRIDYTTHELQAEDWYKPKKPTDLKDSIHYNQIGYNEIGIETARNTCILLGYLNDSEEETTVRFVDWTGVCDIEQVKPAVNGQTGSLVVPLVTPVYRSKELSYDITDGLKYEYYDLLTSTYQVKSGTLSVVERPDITVSVG